MLGARGSPMRGLTVAKVVLTIAAAYGGVGSYIADWNATHIHNPAWPPHAKFHNAQSMSLGAALLLITAGVLWRRPALSRAELGLGAVLASTYGATQLSALLYPGTALVDPPSRGSGPQGLIAAGLLVLSAGAYLIGSRGLRAGR